MAIRKTLPVILLTLIWALLPAVQTFASVQLGVLARDPEATAVLGLDDRLALHIGYTSEQPLRLRVDTLYHDMPHEVGAVTSPATLQPSGEGESLVWIRYTNPTHIDTLRVTALDAQWQVLASVSVAVDVTWREGVAESPRTPAAWVTAMERSERREQDFTYDPLPKPTESLWDIFFLISVASLPVYLLLQVQMLRRYRKRWRELAIVPLVSLLPLIIFSLIGFGMNLELWVSFLFRCVPFALAYLLVLWLIKRLWSGRLPTR